MEKGSVIRAQKPGHLLKQGPETEQTVQQEAASGKVGPRGGLSQRSWHLKREAGTAGDTSQTKLINEQRGRGEEEREK